MPHGPSVKFQVENGAFSHSRASATCANTAHVHDDSPHDERVENGWKLAEGEQTNPELRLEI